MEGLNLPNRLGWWNMACWNGLSVEQQARLIEHGNLPINYRPEGECPNGAEVEVTTIWDRAPGPRFYCARCGADYLIVLAGVLRDMRHVDELPESG